MVQNLSFHVRPDPYGAFRQATDDRVARERAAEEQRRAEQTRNTNASLANAISREDYDGPKGATAIAAAGGDADQVVAARNMGQEAAFQQAQRTADELDAIVASENWGAWRAWRGTQLARAQRVNLLNADSAQRFDAENPENATPEQIRAIAQRTRALVSQLAQHGQTREGYITAQVTQQRLDREALRDDRRYQNERDRIDQGERRLEAAISRGGSGGVSGSQEFSRANSLRDEYNQQTQSFRTVADIAARSEAYVSRIPQTGASGQGDVGLVYALAKIYDPTSVVREGEFATMARQGGYGEQMRSWVLQAQGRGFSDEIRRQILSEIRNGLRSQQAQRDQTRSRYASLAQRASIDPSLVIDDYEASGSPAQSPGGGNALPPVSQRVVGQEYTMPNGDRATWNGRDFD